jgi:hypothetical protein
MTLAPIRGAPVGAPIPDFPIEEPRVKPAQLTAAPASDKQPPTPPVRQRNTPIEINAGGVTFTFRVIPEQPAIARASLTVHIAAGAAGSSSFADVRLPADVSVECQGVPCRSQQ